jgi:hypothetical protein
MQKLKIDLLKFNGAKPFTAKDGTEFVAIPIEANNVYVGQKGHYLELTLMDNKDGVDQYGNEGFVTVDVGKQRRESGEKGPIIGNWKHHGSKSGWNDRPASEATRQPSGQKPATPTQADDDCEDIPF